MMERAEKDVITGKNRDGHNDTPP